jgi:hypothetical protein
MASIDDILGTPQSHPAYGQIVVSRRTVTPPISLYGSSIRHSSTISIRISRSELRRNLSDDRHYAHDGLIEVELSPIQWAEFISGIGMGGGVPCTIRRIKGEDRIPDPPVESKREQFINEFRADVRKVAQLCDEAIRIAREMAAKPTVGKKEREEFVGRLGMLRQAIASDMPFVADQFNEQMDRTVAEAKGEVDAFITNLIVHTGLTALRHDMVAIEAERADEPKAIEGKEPESP